MSDAGHAALINRADAITNLGVPRSLSVGIRCGVRALEEQTCKHQPVAWWKIHCFFGHFLEGLRHAKVWQRSRCRSMHAIKPQGLYPWLRNFSSTSQKYDMMPIKVS